MKLTLPFFLLSISIGLLSCNRKEKILNDTTVAIDYSNVTVNYYDKFNYYDSKESFLEDFQLELEFQLQKEGIQVIEEGSEYTIRINKLTGYFSSDSIATYNKTGRCGFCIWGSCDDNNTSGKSNYRSGNTSVKYQIVDDSNNSLQKEGCAGSISDCIIYNSNESKCDTMPGCTKWYSNKYVSPCYTNAFEASKKASNTLSHQSTKFICKHKIKNK